MASVDYGTKYKPARVRLFELLADLAWHSHLELEEVAGNRYTARLLELRREGFLTESQPAKREGEGKLYRLVSTTPGTPQRKQVKVFFDEGDAKDLLRGTVTLGARKALIDAIHSYQKNRGKL